MANETFAAAPLALLSRPAARPTERGTDLGRAVEQLLTAFVDDRVAAIGSADPALELLTTTARDAVLSPGKRIRPAFAYWGWRGAGGGPDGSDAVLPALAALEMLHAFALVHDDVMDDSPVRRGRPTAHRALAGRHRQDGMRGDARRFGQSGAILVGDLCLVWADELIGSALLPADQIRRARALYDRMRAETIAGQFLDVLAESASTWTLERAILTARLKTASYTVMWPLLFGAALAGLTDVDTSPLTAAYRRYGIAVGEAFQLRDDLLDLYGDVAVTRKALGADAAAGKPTVLLQLARAQASRQQAEELERLLRPGPGLDLPRLAEVVAATGATERLRRMIIERVVDATDALDRAPLENEVREALSDLATAAAWRAA
jgi:geranylgeranyl diphosphate synthase type I